MIEQIVALIAAHWPTIIISVLGGIGIWAGRILIGAIFRGLWWVLRAVGRTILNAIKWKIGWY
jgi:hypothetical protein